MKGKFEIKKSSKDELEFLMYCLIIMCVSCLLFVFFRNLDLCYDLGKDDTDNLIVKLLHGRMQRAYLSDAAQCEEGTGLYQTKFGSDYVNRTDIGMQQYLADDIQRFFVRRSGRKHHSDGLSVAGRILPVHRLPVQSRHTDAGGAGFDNLMS